MLLARNMRRALSAVALLSVLVAHYDVDALPLDVLELNEISVDPVSQQVAEAEQTALKQARVAAAAQGGKGVFVRMAKTAVGKAAAKRQDVATRHRATKANAAHERELKKENAVLAKKMSTQARKFRAESKKARATASEAEEKAADTQKKLATGNSNREEVKTTTLGDTAEAEPAKHQKPPATASQTKSSTDAIVATTAVGATKSHAHAMVAASAKTELPPSSHTQKNWEQLASESDDAAEGKMFFSHLLTKVESTEVAYDKLLKQESHNGRTAQNLETLTGTMLKQFYSPDAGKSVTAKSHPELGEGLELGTDSGAMPNVPTQKKITKSARIVHQNSAVQKIEQRLAESRESAARAASAEAEAEKVVEHQRAELARAKQEAAAPAPLSKDTEALEQQQKQYKTAESTLKKEKGEVAAVAAHAAAAAEEVAKKEVEKAKKRDAVEHEEHVFTKQMETGQEVAAAEKAEHAAVSNAQDAVEKVHTTEAQLGKEEKQVAHLEAEKADREANAVPLAMRALRKEVNTHNTLSSDLQILSDKAQTNEAAQQRLDREAKRVRDESIGIKNSAEEHFDQLSQKLGKLDKTSKASTNLGEALKTPRSRNSKQKWKTAISQEHAVVEVEHSEMKKIVEQARQITLDAAKIEEEQSEAAGASSRVEVNAHVVSQELSRDKASMSFKSQKPSASQIQSKLKKLGKQDHSVYIEMSHLNGQAMNAAAAEHAGIKKTNTEVELESGLLHSIANDLLPAH